MWSHGPWDWFPWMWIFPLIFLVVMVLFLLRGPGWPMWGRHGMREREDTIAHATKFGKEKHFILKKRVGTELDGYVNIMSHREEVVRELRLGPNNRGSTPANSVIVD